MKRVKRTDLAKVEKSYRTPAGYLVADAYLTRAGVFVYHHVDGTITRELRHPDDVFDEASLKTMALIPVTRLHPAGEVNAKTAKLYQLGSTGENITRDGNLAGARISITDADLANDVENKVIEEMSMGYDCIVVPEQGTFEGQPYDWRQTQITYDHAAVVPRGRAGRDVRIRMDGAHQMAGDVIDPTKEKTMKIKIGEKEFEVSEDVGAAIAAEASKQKGEADKVAGEVAAVKADRDTVKGKLDAAEAALKTATEKKDAIDPTKVGEIVRARVALERVAVRFLGEQKLDGMDDIAVKKAIIAKVQPELKLDSASAEYVAGVFEFIAKAAEKSNPALDVLRIAATPPAGKKDEEKTARDEMIAQQNDAWRDYGKSLAKS